MHQASFIARVVPALAVITFLFSISAAQAEHVPAPSDEIIRRKSVSKTVKFGPGGTISIIGAPDGSVAVEGWDKNEVLISAEIEVRGKSEEDAARIAGVTGFYVDEDVLQIRIHSLGPHDKKYLKKVDRKFPKRLRKNPFSVNYKVFVPAFSDLRIDGGRGDFRLRGVEGVFVVNFLESNAVLNLVGGNVRVTVGSGNVDVTVGARSWRGRSADIQLVKGTINLRLPRNLNADLLARILRTGKITNGYGPLQAKPRTEFSERYIYATAGNGGANLAFTIGDGDMNIEDFEKPA